MIGALHLPVQNDLLLGDNQITELNGRPVRMRDCQDISEATLLTTDHLQIPRTQNAEKFNQLIQKVNLYRTWGDCFGYYLLATGRADIMIDPIMHRWDTAALIPVIRGAGGRISDYHGNDAIKGNSVIAAHPNLHPMVISALND
jgi:fructose-1,6-bisphosphatase/inositol monophosphatase family enzyme